MRSSDAGEQLHHRDRDRGEHAVQDVEQQHARRGEDGQQELPSTEPPQPPELADVDQPDRRVDDDATEGGRGEGGDDRAERDDGDDGQHRRHQRVELRARTAGLGDRRAAGARADREPADERGADVRGPHGQELLVVVHPGATAGGEGACGEDVVGVPDDEDAERRQQQDAQVGRVERGQADVHAVEGHVADRRDALRRQVEHRDDGRRQQHDDERHRDLRVAGSEEQQQAGDGDADGERRPRHAVPQRVPGERPDVLEERVAVDVDPRDLAELARDHDHGDARHVADEHRSRQQVADEAQAQHAGEQRIQADEQRQHGGERGVADRVARRERGEHGRRHESRRRLGPHRQEPGGADHRVEHHRDDDHGEPRLRRESRRAPSRPSPGGSGTR